jgi:putative tricarboxylic transport membrane protein
MIQVFMDILSIQNLIMMNIGVAVGVFIGAMPGLNTILAITVLLPFTFGMDSITGMYLLLGASCGGLFGGSVSAILINTPGTPAACATVLDGYPLAKKGRAGDALRSALVASTFGGLVSCFVLLFLAPVIAKFAMNFASPEFFSLCVFGMSTVIGLASGQEVKGLIMALIGLLISTVGIDSNDGGQRFMFNNFDLLAGINPVVVMLGIFALSEVLMRTQNIFEKNTQPITVATVDKPSLKCFEIVRKYWKTLLKSSGIGVLIGAIPGTGGAMAAMLSYNEAKRSSKESAEFGTGSIEGIVAPESSNNAVSGGSLIPMLTLGIPGDAGAAVLLGALTMQGVTVGTTLFTGDRTWVYAIMGGLFIINIFMFIQGNLFTKIFANITKISDQILLPSIIVLCTVGAYSVSNTRFNVLLMIIFGIFGYFMKRLDFPLPPLIVAMVLGPTLEQNLRRSLTLSQGSYSVFITEPMSLVILVASLMFFLGPSLKKLFQKITSQKNAKK